MTAVQRLALRRYYSSGKGWADLAQEFGKDRVDHVLMGTLGYQVLCFEISRNKLYRELGKLMFWCK